MWNGIWNDKGKEMIMYVVKYTGKFGFIKPWTAVRDELTFSQQFLTPSIIEGIEKKLFPELLNSNGISRIKRHKLKYKSMSSQQEVTQTRGEDKKGMRDRSIITRGLLIDPILYLAFENEKDAANAITQHICLCRNEDVLLPDENIETISEEDFNAMEGFELRFGMSEQSFKVGHNRFDNANPMYGWLEFNGQSLL